MNVFGLCRHILGRAIDGLGLSFGLLEMVEDFGNCATFPNQSHEFLSGWQHRQVAL